jgi:hypothetical protein
MCAARFSDPAATRAPASDEILHINRPCVGLRDEGVFQLWKSTTAKRTEQTCFPILAILAAYHVPVLPDAFAVPASAPH